MTRKKAKNNKKLLFSSVFILVLLAAGMFLFLSSFLKISNVAALIRTYTSDHTAFIGAGNTSKNVTKTTLAYFHSCALTTNQIVYCSGLNTSGQLGDGTVTNRSTSVQFPLATGKRVEKIATVSYHTCVLTIDQDIYCAGNNTDGQLGDGTLTNRTSPIQFPLPGGKKATDLITSPNAYTCALTTDQLVYCAGYNDVGQLGDGTTTVNRTTPVQFQLPVGKKAAKLAFGNYHTCVLTIDQLVYCAGYNSRGQLGDATSTNRSTPVLYQLPAGKKAASVSADASYTCVLTTDQLVYCAGYNGCGHLGDGSLTDRSTPVLYQLPAGKTAASVTPVSGCHVCVLTTDQLVYCAGYNGDGALGDGTIVDRPTAVLFQLPAGKKAREIQYVRGPRTCVITTDQKVYCSGKNNYGPLGDGSFTNRLTPVEYQLPAGKTVTSMSANTYSSCAHTNDRLVYCAGYNGYGGLSDTTLVDRATPVQFIVP